MADVLNENLQDLARSEITELQEATAGMIIAFTSLISMACLSIYFGAHRSILCFQNKSSCYSCPKIVIRSKKDAVVEALLTSCMVLTIYGYLKLFSETYINHLLTLFAFCDGTMSLAHELRPSISKFLPQDYEVRHHVLYAIGSKLFVNSFFGTADLIAFVICSVIGSIYAWNKHWIVKNIFGIVFAVNGIASLHLNNIINGCIFLGLLFIDDIIWVFATDVMETLVRSLEAPCVLLFPQDLLENWLFGNHFSGLGLGDITIPGAFIALFLRFDESLKRGQKLYFYSSLFGYIFGLIVTILNAVIFNHGQPALLYLVPACVGFPVVTAFIKGDMNALLNYRDYPKAHEA